MIEMIQCGTALYVFFLFLCVLPLEVQSSREVVSNLNQFNTAICLCLLQTTICISIGICRNLLCIQWFGIVCFVDISGIVGYLSLFKLSFYNISHIFPNNQTGALYADGTHGRDKLDDTVHPGKIYTYKWSMKKSFTPTKDDDNCIPQGYHPHIRSHKDIDTGLIGMLIVCKPGMFIIIYFVA